MAGWRLESFSLRRLVSFLAWSTILKNRIGMDHVCGQVKTRDAAAWVAVEVRQGLAFADLANESIGEAGSISSSAILPLLADELAVFHDQGLSSAQFVVRIRSGVIGEARGGSRVVSLTDA